MDEKVYEMLWDCRYCGTQKLLGKTHRHCPSCGAPQENAPRYFPPDEEKVAVQDHQFFGADLVCPHCTENQSRRSKHCGACGGPLEGAAEVARRADVLSGGATPPPAAKKSNAGKIIAAVLLLGLLGTVALALVFFLWKRDAAFEVAEQTWERSIAVERYGPVEDKAWCDELPSGAEVISRSKAKRSTQKVEDGEDCKTRKVDNGDGTYTEKQECTPRYKDEAVMDDECKIRVKRWSVVRTEKSQGPGDQAPTWPEVRLAKEGDCEGCEREGERKETYRVVLASSGSSEHSECEVDPSRFSRLGPKTRVKGQVRALGGGVVCDSLTPE